MGVMLLSSLIICADVCLHVCAESVFIMIVSNNTPIGAGGALRSPSLSSVDEYIRCWSLLLDARWFAILPTGSKLLVLVSHLKCATALAGSRRHWRHSGRNRAVDNHTHGDFMDIPFARSVEKGPYKTRPARLIPRR